MPPPIDRLNDALADRYRVERELGEGGMATVYLAEDLKHDRKVALKVLRPELAAVVGAERFLTEIRTTANLQHPHILPLHDSGEADGFLYYVMPYVEGESLRERLEREKQLPVEDALAIAEKVAGALQYAHEHGVVHRDIKPANILLSRGEPLVADFGIALAASRSGGGERLTETGMSLGTPHYMSPEQATGEQRVDHRSDVYSLGCILHEMLTGQPPHPGPTSQAVLAHILTRDPRPLTELRTTVPSHVEAAVAKTLERLPADRFDTAVDFARALRDSAFRYRGGAPVRPDRSTQDGRRPELGWAAALAILMALAAWGWLRDAPPPPVMRHVLAVPLPFVGPGELNERIDLAPNGERLVYLGPLAPGGARLWQRELDVLEATPIEGSERAVAMSIAPDGERIAFVNEARELLVAPFEGGTPIRIADVEINPVAIDWGSDGKIYLEDLGGLVRIAASGGTAPEELTRVRSGESRHIYPEALSGGRRVLFVVRHGGDPAENEIAVKDLDTGRRETLVRGTRAVVSPTGHLLYVSAEGNLFAAPFDERELRLAGTPSLITGGIRVGQFGSVELGLSETGHLLYVARDAAAEATELVWVDRNGNEEPLDPDWVEAFRTVALSPDGRHVAVSIASRGEEDVWIRDLEGGGLERISTEGELNWRPAWRPDGNAIGYISDRSGGLNAYVQPLDGDGGAIEVLPGAQGVEEMLWSPSGEWIVLRSGGGISGGSRDILAVRLGEDEEPRPLLTTGAHERTPTLSPDGRWLAFRSDGAGVEQVLVRPFPAGSDEWVVSPEGAQGPLWSPRGDEIFYRGGDAMIAASVRTTPTFSVTGRTRLFESAAYRVESQHRAFDVTADGSRFLMIRVSDQGGKVVLVENFVEELEQR